MPSLSLFSKRKAHTSDADRQHHQDNILSALSVALVVTDTRGRIQRLNTQASRDLALGGTDIAGRPIQGVFGIFHDKDDLTSGILQRIRNGEHTIELPANTYIQRAESTHKFYSRGEFIREQAADVSAPVYLLFRNIENELTQEYILHMALGQTLIFPWFFDLDLDRMTIDHRWFTHLGIPAGDCTLTADDFFARVHPADRQMLSDALAAQIAGKLDPSMYTYRLLRGDGTWEWFQEKSVYLGQVNNAPYRIVGVCQSIQDHKTIEANLIAARDKARESDRLKSAFLANMSHEIRTPLNAIVGFSSLLADRATPLPPDEAYEYGRLISTNSELLLMLISDILDLSRIESNTMEFHLADHSLNALLTDIAQKHKLHMPPGVGLMVDLPGTDAILRTDSMRLQQVIDNLINNAIKFTSEGEIRFGYSLSANGQRITLFVSDTGKGISREMQRHIFERFYKADPFTQGAGLGLSICQTITEALGGTISVCSIPGQGTRFTLTLPLAADRAAASDTRA